MKRKANSRDSDAADKNDDPLRLDNFLCFAIYSANLAFSRVYRPILEPLGLTYVQYLLLVALWDTDGQAVGDLGERLFLKSSTLTPVIKRLETLGYVNRTRGLHDERQVHVHLTEAGKRLRRRACDIPKSIAATAGLDASDLNSLQNTMLVLRERLLGAMDSEDAGAVDKARPTTGARTTPVKTRRPEPIRKQAARGRRGD